MKWEVIAKAGEQEFIKIQRQVSGNFSKVTRLIFSQRRENHSKRVQPQNNS